MTMFVTQLLSMITCSFHLLPLTSIFVMHYVFLNHSLRSICNIIHALEVCCQLIFLFLIIKFDYSIRFNRLPANSFLQNTPLKLI